jgi:cytochrome c oxidase assembly protein subunit 15
MFASLREKTNGFTLTPKQFTVVAIVASTLLTLIIATGAAVRLTDSGLGCQSWPTCRPGQLAVPTDLHSLIEFGNRMLSGIVTFVVLGAAILAFRRRPKRKDLIVLAWVLPLGAFIQAVLGALSVKSDLGYGWVMAHFATSMVITIFAVLLVWRCIHEAGERPRSSDRLTVWSIRGLLVMTAAAWISGMGVTAAGPHAGGHAGQTVSPRWEPKTSGSLEWVVHRHGRFADLLGIFAVGVWFLLWRKNASRELRINSTVFVVLVGIQGLIGSIQWHERLPAELVWLHVIFGTLCWISALWFCFAAGRLEPRTEPAPVAGRRLREGAAERVVEQVDIQR